MGCLTHQVSENFEDGQVPVRRFDFILQSDCNESVILADLLCLQSFGRDQGQVAGRLRNSMREFCFRGRTGHSSQN